MTADIVSEAVLHVTSNPNVSVKGSSRIVIIFTSVHRVRCGEGVSCDYDYDALHFHTGSLKINIFQVGPTRCGRG